MNLLEGLEGVVINISDKIRDEKLQYRINRATTKRSALPLGKINKYEYLTREEVLSPQR